MERYSVRADNGDKANKPNCYHTIDFFLKKNPKLLIQQQEKREPQHSLFCAKVVTLAYK